MLERGVDLAPSAFEAGFVALAHEESDIDATLTADRVSLGTGGAIEGVEIVAPRDARLPPVRVSGCSNRLERVTVRGSPAGGIRVTEGSLELVDSLVG